MTESINQPMRRRLEGQVQKQGDTLGGSSTPQLALDGSERGPEKSRIDLQC